MEIPSYTKRREFYDTSRIFVGLSHVPLMFKPSTFVDKVKIYATYKFNKNHNSVILRTVLPMIHELKCVEIGNAVIFQLIIIR